MVGPWLFAGRRFVATRALKDLRFGAEPDVFGGRDLGSYLAVYWILDGRHDEHVDWALRQVHVAARARPHVRRARPHPHAALPARVDGRGVPGGVPGGVPAELALDHPFGGLTATVVKLDNGVTIAALGSWVRELQPELEIGFTPIPLPADAPVTQNEHSTGTYSTCRSPPPVQRPGGTSNAPPLSSSSATASARCCGPRRSSRRSPAPTCTPTSSGDPAPRSRRRRRTGAAGRTGRHLRLLR